MDANKKLAKESKTKNASPRQKLDWEKPQIEEVTEQVMAQPYIRFT